MGEVSNAAPAAGAGQADATQAADGAQKTDPKVTPGQASAQTPGKSDGTISAAAAEAKRKLKIDNEEVDEDEVIKTYRDRKGHQKVANQKFQEGLKLRKQSEEFITAMNDPSRLVETLQKMGWKDQQIRTVAEQYLASVLENEMMDPKEKEFRTTKQKLEAFEKKEKLQKEAEEQQHQEALKAKFAKQYETEFIEALKTSGLPPTKDAVGEMAKYIARAAKIKMPMTALEAAKLVQQDLEARDRHRFQNLDPETIVKIVGEDGLKRIRDFDVSRIKDPSANLKTPEDQREASRNKPKAERMTPEQWRAFNRK